MTPKMTLLPLCVTQCDMEFLTAPAVQPCWMIIRLIRLLMKQNQSKTPAAKSGIFGYLFPGCFYQLGDPRDGAGIDLVGFLDPSQVLGTLSCCAFLVVAIPFPIPWI